MRMKQINVALPRPILKSVNKYCKERGMFPSAWIRQLVFNECEKLGIIGPNQKGEQEHGDKESEQSTGTATSEQDNSTETQVYDSRTNRPENPTG